MTEEETRKEPTFREQLKEETGFDLRWLWLLLIIPLILLSFNIIGAGERGVRVMLGNPSDSIISEGITFKIPLIQQIIIFDIKTQKDEVKATAASKDLQTVSADVAINYHLQQASAPRIYKEVGVGYVDRILSPAIQESIKAATAQYTAEELITKRELVRETIKTLLVAKMEPRGIVIEEVLITDFDFSESFNEAIENKVTMQQNALAAENKLKQIEFEAQQRITQAQGEAQAQKIQIEALKVQGGAEYVQLQAIAKWNGQLPTVTGGVTPFINLNLNNSN